jgi:hypothetical protein
MLRKHGFKVVRALVLGSVFALVSLYAAAAAIARDDGPAKAPAGAPGVLQGPLVIPFQSVEYLVLVPVRINGAGPYWFDLDSGASSCVIDRALAKTLNLPLGERRQGGGAGKGTVDVDFTPNVTFGLPGVDVLVPRVAAIDLSGLRPSIGREVVGILGYDFFERYVVEIDYDAQVLRLHEPKGFSYSGGATRLDLVIERRLPYVVARITVAGQAAADKKLLVDSGSSDAVDTDLIEQSSGPRLEVIGGVGIGKEYKVHIGRVEKTRLGTLELTNAFGVAPGVALIGGEVLHRFTVTLDYSRKKMLLEPNRFFAEPFLADASGLDLRLAEPDYKNLRVHNVLAHSPAAEAGLRAGDLITAIDGCPAPSLTLSQVQRMFSHEDRPFALTIQRGKEARCVKLKLRKLL